jgi:LacI family transcriptional regulator
MHESYVIACGGESDSDGEIRGSKAMEELLALRPRPDALFCFNDSIAVGAMLKAFEAGLHIPEDIAIVGCGNFHYSSKLIVPLSSIDQRAKEIGESWRSHMSSTRGLNHDE